MPIIFPNLRRFNDLLRQGWEWTPGSDPRHPGYTDPPQTQPAPTISPAAESTVTGIEPQALDAILYGKDIPEYVGGSMRIGGRIIEGPFFDHPSSTAINPFVEYIASFAHYANGATGTIAVTEFSLRGRVVWTAADGATIPDLDVEFRLGTEDQLPFSTSISRFGSRALPCKGHILARVIVSLNQFAGVVPFPSVLIEDSSFGDPDDGIPRQDALELILQTARLEPDEYEVDVTGAWDAVIIPDKADLLSTLQSFRKEYPNWDITFTDKLRITERAAYVVALNLTRGKIIKDTWASTRQEPLTQARERLLKFIDSGRDYEFNTAKAVQEIFPLATTSSVESETIELPVVMPASTAMADNFFSLFAQDVASLKMEWVGTVDSFGLEPGDAVRFNDTTTGLDLWMRATEVSRNWADFTVDVRADMAYNCGLSAPAEFDPLVCALQQSLSSDTVTFTGLDFGAPSTNRLIIATINIAATVGGSAFVPGCTIGSVTIGGVSAVEVVSTAGVDQCMTSAIYYATVPTGTTGSVVIVTSDGVFINVQLGISRMLTATPAVFDTAEAHQSPYVSTAPLVTSIDVPEDGVVICASMTFYGAGITWTGATVECHVANTPFLSGTRDCAIYQGGAETDRTIAVSCGVDYINVCSASWRLS